MVSVTLSLKIGLCQGSKVLILILPMKDLQNFVQSTQSYCGASVSQPKKKEKEALFGQLSLEKQ